MTTLSKVIDYDHMLKITSEFSRLGERCYLENAGATLYPKSLLEHVHEDLMNNVYMNPHTDKYTKDCIEQIRCLILKHFNTDPSTYTVIFTSGTTQALKLVVESFQFACDQHEILNCGSFVYLRDNHTSVLGLREIATDKNADVIHISHDDFLKTLEPRQSSPTFRWKEKFKNEGNTLLVYPAQSNFNGNKYPLDCIDNIKEGILNSCIRKHLCRINCNWYVLLDAASYVATNKLDLSKTQPDFVCLSFYKIFGYPTGLGALIVKNSSANVLSQKKYFGGGTVDVVLSSEDFHVKRHSLTERFEDGTHPFLSIIALKHCFDIMNRLIPKVVNDNIMETISLHTFYLAKDLHDQLKTLKHKNGRKAAVLYTDNDFKDNTKQGSIVTFNILRENGSYVGYAEFQHMADLFNINVRTGCFCNSGSCQRHLSATNKEMKEMYKAGHKCGDDFDLIEGRPTGAVRASFGYYNTFNDVDKLLRMISQCFVKIKHNPPRREINSYKKKEKPMLGSNLNGNTLHIVNDKKYYKSIEVIPNSAPIVSKGDIILQEMAIFPIKSCGAYKIKSGWKIGPKGFEFDREWMIIKENGVCLTQKQNTRMCLIRPKIDLKQKLLILSFKGKSPISVPLEPTVDNSQKEATLCQSRVCTDIVKGVDCGDEVADWISEALETSFLRLIRQSDTDNRRQKKKGDEEATLISLSNQAQFLLINKATVRWLSKRIKDPLFTEDIDDLTDRFRGNLIIEMDQALLERDWQRLIMGKHEFKVEGQCPRCQMVCIDQKTGEKTVEPLRTISEQFAGKLRFGIYLSYVGTVDGSKDYILKNYSQVKPFSGDDDISRFKDWFFMYFLSNCSCSCPLELDAK